jgi:acetyltransferase
VFLDLGTASEVRSAFQRIVDNIRRNRPGTMMDGVCVESMVVKPNGRELLIGVTSDPVFGPVITFGAGGTTVEVQADRAVALPPLNAVLAREMIGRTHVSRMLGPFRNLPAADAGALEAVLLRVSEMVCEIPSLREMDINPLILDENGAIAADARVVVEYRHSGAERYAHMAIHPYPAHLLSRWQLPDGTDVVIRPIRPEDAGLVREFVAGLSEEARFFRFMNVLQELSGAPADPPHPA